MEQEQKKIEARDYYTIMTHFYRGELGRIMDWRRRLDITTNWAIMGATAMITFGFGSTEVAHLPFLFANYLVFLLLMIEARRYRIYDAFRTRVRFLEVHFILPSMMHETRLLQGDWKERLAEDLLRPGFKIGPLRAMLRRFRRNYVWIFLLIAVAWFAKIWLHYQQAPRDVGFVQILLEHIPFHGVLFWVMAGAIYAVLIAMVIAVVFFRKDSFDRFFFGPKTPQA